MDFDILKQLYFHEWKRKEDLSNAVGLPALVVVALISGTFYLARTYPYHFVTCRHLFLGLTVLFIAALLVTLVLEGACLRKLYLSLMGVTYKTLPPVKKFNEYERLVEEQKQVSAQYDKVLEQYHRSQPMSAAVHAEYLPILNNYEKSLGEYRSRVATYLATPGQPSDGNLKINEALKAQLGEATDHNAQSNKTVGDLIIGAYKLIIYSLVPLAVAAFVYLVTEVLIGHA